MPPAWFAQHSAAAGPEHQAFLNQERLDHILQSIPGLRESCGERLYTHRTAGVMLGDATEVTAVHGVEAECIHLKAIERYVSSGAVDLGGAVHGGKVTHAAQQSAGDPRRAARAAGNFRRTIG